MNNEAKEFRSKYFFSPRRETLSQKDVDIRSQRRKEMFLTIERNNKLIKSNIKKLEENQR